MGNILTILSGLLSALKAWFTWRGKAAGEDKVRRQAAEEEAHARESQAQAVADAVAGHSDHHRFADRLRDRGRQRE